MIANRSILKKVPATSLFVSEPHPHYFGNDENPAKNPNWTNSNWLKSRFHFAFAEWRSPITNFGVLRVLNDDLVQPDRGFGAHGHQNMEIATFVLQGELTHRDSMGNEESLKRGSVQFMSAGTGVEHSEFNKNKTLPLHFLQLWILPKTQGLRPRYGSFNGEKHVEMRQNKWAHMVTWDEKKFEDDKTAPPIRLNQDVNIFVSEVSPGTELEFPVLKGRQAYVVTAEGDSTISAVSSDIAMTSTTEFSEGDAAEVFGELKLTFKALTKSFWLIVEMPWDGKSRFRF